MEVYSDLFYQVCIHDEDFSSFSCSVYSQLMHIFVSNQKKKKMLVRKMEKMVKSG